MLSLNQPRKQLQRIIKHHLHKFPNMLISWFISKSLSSSMPDNEYLTTHPVEFVAAMPGESYRDYFFAWDNFCSKSVPSTFSSIIPKGFMQYADVPAIRHLEGDVILFPTRVFQPTEMGPTMTRHLRNRVNRRYWFQYEASKLLLPHRKMIRPVISLLSSVAHTSDPLLWLATSVQWKRNLLPVLLQAVDYVCVGVSQGWDARTGGDFYAWYETNRRISKDFLHDLRMGTVNLHQEPSYCSGCGGWVGRCGCVRAVPGQSAPRNVLGLRPEPRYPELDPFVMLQGPIVEGERTVMTQEEYEEMDSRLSAQIARTMGDDPALEQEEDVEEPEIQEEAPMDSIWGIVNVEEPE